jgi:hypothetical protein
MKILNGPGTEAFDLFGVQEGADLLGSEFRHHDVAEGRRDMDTDQLLVGAIG